MIADMKMKIVTIIQVTETHVIVMKKMMILMIMDHQTEVAEEIE